MVAFPSPLHRALAQVRRDARMIVGGWLGHRQPLVPRQVRAAARGTRSADAARAVRVLEVVRETGDAVSLVLADPAGAPLAFTPGQFFTVIADLDGRTVRRAYSASSDHRHPEQLRLTVKRVPGGRMSTYLTTGVRAGQMLRVLGPSGSFTYQPEPARRAHAVLIGGGSGITPLMAIARAVLAGEPGSRVTLLYGNRGPADIIFAAELEALAAGSGERLRIRHVVETAPDGWPDGCGRLDRDTVAAELAALGCDADASYYVCGPEPMMVAARQALEGAGVPGGRIREERFTGPDRRGPATLTLPQPVTVRAGGRSVAARTSAGDTLLDAGLAAGVAMPFSCGMGGCGACKVRLVEGTVTTEEPSCLSAGERDAGYVLACVSRPTSPVTVEVE